VAGDVKNRGLDTLEPVAMVYLPMRQDEVFPVSLVLRGEGDVMSLASGVTGVLAKINPELPVRNTKSMEEVVETTLSQQRSSMWLFAALAGLAFLLAAVGIYSVLAYSVRSRVQEISVRMALGAGAGDVLRLVVAEGMKPTLLGIGLGAFGAYALGGLLS